MREFNEHIANALLYLDFLSDELDTSLLYTHTHIELIKKELNLFVESDDDTESVEETRDIFNTVINFAIEDEYPMLFLQCWREGDFESIKKQWPDFTGYLGGEYK